MSPRPCNALAGALLLLTAHPSGLITPPRLERTRRVLAAAGVQVHELTADPLANVPCEGESL